MCGQQTFFFGYLYVYVLLYVYFHTQVTNLCQSMQTLCEADADWVFRALVRQIRLWLEREKERLGRLLIEAVYTNTHMYIIYCLYRDIFTPCVSTYTCTICMTIWSDIYVYVLVFAYRLFPFRRPAKATP